MKEYQLGRTKVFLRSLQAKLLDRLRSDTLAAAATKLQARWKGFLGRRAFVQQRSAAVNIQAHVRGWLARRLAESMRRTKAATTIQAAWRCVVAQRALAAARKAAVMMQSVWRMRQCKLQLVQLRRCGAGDGTLGHGREWPHLFLHSCRCISAAILACLYFVADTWLALSRSSAGWCLSC